MEKYVDILMQRTDRDEFVKYLELLASAFQNESVLIVVNAVGISLDRKVEFLASICNSDKKEFINLLKILALNSKLAKIPELYNRLIKKIALEKNIYYADIYSKEQLNDSEVLKHEEELSKYFQKEIKLKNLIHNKNEIKIYIEDLGYEIIVSEQSLKEKIKQYIMKAM